MAKELSIPKSTMGDLATKDLGMVSRAMVLVQQLTTLQMAKRFKRCKKLVNWLKNHGARKVIVFSDDKNFYVD